VDATNNSAAFDRADICLSGRFECEKDYRSLIVRLPEETTTVNSSVALNLAKLNDLSRFGDEEEAAESVCYYLSGGASVREHFELDKLSGVLRPKRQLDREFKERYELVVKASEHCFCDRYELMEPAERAACEPMHLTSENELAYDSSDISQLRVVVLVEDVNDNEPKFERNLYQVGIISDVQKAEIILESFVS
jgi:hypothetical protein